MIYSGEHHLCVYALGLPILNFSSCMAHGRLPLKTRLGGGGFWAGLIPIRTVCAPQRSIIVLNFTTTTTLSVQTEASRRTARSFCTSTKFTTDVGPDTRMYDAIVVCRRVTLTAVEFYPDSEQ